MTTFDLAARFVAAEVVLPCDSLDQTLAFFTSRLGFRLDVITPADEPRELVLSGHGLRVRLRRGAGGSPGVLRIACHDRAMIADGARTLTAPNGTVIELCDADAPLVPTASTPSFSRCRSADPNAWTLGRAGMRYRDLVPDRQGGRIIASHIRIDEGGPVPDYVHFHEIHVQLIYCRAGWVRVVYEDQGPPFVLRSGDCVLQPPRIRHRVLECSPGLEVIEVGCPAEHETRVDHELSLPTDVYRPERSFGGQRFVRHQAEAARWEAHAWPGGQPSAWPGWQARDLGIAEGTGGLASARVLRRRGAPEPAAPARHEGELLLWVVLAGGVTLRCEGHGVHGLETGDAVVVPPRCDLALDGATEDVELLEVTMPALGRGA